MTLRKDVNDPHGRLLIRVGTELTEKHLHALSLWGIPGVHIERDSNGEFSGAVALSPEALEDAKARAAELFRHNLPHRDHPVVKQLFAQSVARLAQEIAQREADTTRQSPRDEAHGAERGAANPQRDIITQKWTVEALVKKTETIASLPAVYQELIAVVYHPRSSATDVANVISSDTGLTARLLRIVNSAFYGFPQAIDTVVRAIAIVGTNEVCDLALATSVIQVFGKTLAGVGDMRRFWRHSLWCGAVARLLASHRREPNTERFFVAGLLHDIGRLVILLHIPEMARRTHDVAAASGRPRHTVEQEVLGFTHAKVGGALLEAWNLPVSQSDAARHHHGPRASDRHAVETAIVHAADVIACASGMTYMPDTPVPPLVMDAWERLAIDANALPSIVERAEMQVADLARILEVDDES